MTSPHTIIEFTLPRASGRFQCSITDDEVELWRSEKTTPNGDPLWELVDLAVVSTYLLVGAIMEVVRVLRERSQTIGLVMKGDVWFTLADAPGHVQISGPGVVRFADLERVLKSLRSMEVREEPPPPPTPMAETLRPTEGIRPTMGDGELAEALGFDLNACAVMAPDGFVYTPHELVLAAREAMDRRLDKTNIPRIARARRGRTTPDGGAA